MKHLALSVLAGLGLALTPAQAARDLANGDIMIGFRPTGGIGASDFIVIDMGPSQAFKDYTTVQTFSISGLATELASRYGASWHTRTDLFWGAAGTIEQFSQPSGNTDAFNTLYATRAETTNGTLATAWQRKPAGTQAGATSSMLSVYSTFNSFSADPTTADANLVAIQTDAQNTENWKKYNPSSGAAFGVFTGGISGTPGQYLDLFRMEPASGNPLGDLVGRLILNSNATFTFVPDNVVGVNVVQFASATFTAAENIASSNLAVTVNRSGDTSSSVTVTLSTTDGSATAPDDYTAQSNVNVVFGVSESTKTVNIPIVNRPGTQADRSFTVTLGGATGGTTIGAQGTATATITDASIPSTLVFSAETYNVVLSAVSNVATVTVNRTGGTDAVTYTLTASSEGDDNATAGEDYTNPATSFTIPANATSATANIVLLEPAGQTQHRTFTVTLSNVSGGGSVGTPSTAKVRLLVNDAVKPTVALTLPAANAKINENSNDLVTVSGSATDTNGIIDRVEVRLNGAAAVNANLTPNSTGASFNLDVTPVGGLNTITVQAFDALGNASTLLSRSFTYVVKRAINLVINPNTTQGTVTGLKAGVVYEVGKPITLTAKPAAGFAFDRWEGIGLSGPALEVPALNVVMTDAFANSATVPVITAYFVANPFSAAAIGEFNGLVVADGSSTPGNDTNGMISALKVTGTGTFTAKLLIDGLSLSISGVFDNSGVAKFGANRSTTLFVARTTKPSYELTLNMDVTSGPTNTNTITGTLKQRYRSALISNSLIELDRAAFTDTSKAGFYTVAFPARATQTGLTSVDYPQGDGVGTITIDAKGKATVAGTLADNTGFTMSVPLDKNQQIPFYVALYTKATSGKGSIGGVLSFSALANSDVTGTDLFWFRPWQNVHHYPWGWPEGILTDLLGAKYNAALAPVLPGLPASQNNAEISFSDGQLNPSPLEKIFTLTAANSVVIPPLPGETKPDASFTVKLDKAKGGITGTFTHTDGTKPAYKAVILQKGSNTGGYGHFMTVQPKAITGLGESGAVTVQPNN